jgi:hypothetical protein
VLTDFIEIILKVVPAFNGVADQIEILVKATPAFGTIFPYLLFAIASFLMIILVSEVS